MVFVLLVYVAFFAGVRARRRPPPPAPHHAAAVARHFPKHSPLNPDWKGNGRTVTLGFGGDVHFAGAVGENLAKDPSTALGTTIPQLFSGPQLRMVNLETAVTDGTCPEPQDKQYIFDAPASAITALKSATITLATEANDHGLDCGPRGSRRTSPSRRRTATRSSASGTTRRRRSLPTASPSTASASPSSPQHR